MGEGKLRYKGLETSSTSPRKKRRLSPRPGDDVQDEFGPARSSSSAHSRPRYDTYVFDEASYDEDADQRPSLPRHDVDDDFNARLFEAMRDDEGLDAIEGFYSSTQTQHVPNRWRSEASSSYSRAGPSGIVSTDRLVHTDSGVVLNTVIFDLKDALDEEQYAEHIRTGMYRRTHAEEIRRQEAAEKQRRERDAKLKADRKAAQREEEARIRREEREARRYEAETNKARRADYDTAWARLITLPVDQTLRSSDFVWPVGPGDPLDVKHITRFLLGHLSADDDDRTRRKALRAPLLAYHPDRFNRLVERVPSQERESVRKTGLQVSQLLNDVLSSLGGR